MAVRKIINSDKQYTPVVMDKIVLDTVPTVGSFNSVTSDAVARAITEAGNVPAPEASDAGKVLGVLNSSGDIGWVEDQSGTLTQVQSNWAESDNTQVSYIQNKPDLSVYAEASAVETALATKQDVISDLATIRSGAAAGASAVQPASLATVATTGAYYDLSGKPDLSGFATTQAMNTALAGKQDTIEDLSSIRTGAGLGATAVQPSSLAAVATTGDYDDLTNKPTIPAAQVQSDWNESDTSSKSFIRNKPVIPAGVIVDQTYDASSANAQSGTAVASAISTKQDIISDLATIRSGAADGATAVQPGNLATVATTGAYSDLSGTPTIPVVDQSYSSSSVNAQSGVAVAGAIAGKQDTIADLATIRANALLGSTAVQPGDLATVATTGDYDDLTNKPSLATVATSGSYTDLSNKPSIPAAQVNSDWNAASGVAQILNKPNLATVATTGDYDDLLNKPTIPAAVTVDQTYNASSSNPQSGTAVAEAVAAISVDEVPTVTSSDDGKVLKATYSGGTGSYDWESPPTEKNLVAGSNVSITSSGDNVTIAATNTTYTFSTGLTNSSGTVTVTNPLPSSTSSDEDKVLTVDSTGAPVWAASQGGGNEVPSVTSNDDGKILKAAYSGGTGSYSWQADAKKPVVAGTGISITNNTNDVTIAATTPVPAVTSSDDGKVLKATYSGGTGSYAWAAAQGGTTYTAGDGIDISNDTISADVDGTTIGIDSTTKKIKLLSAIPTVDQTYNASSANAQSGVAVAGAIAAISVDEVPAVTSSDDGKILKATYSGGVGSYAWAAASGGTTYTAGDGIYIDPNYNYISVDTDGSLGGISVSSFGVGAKYDGTTINVNSDSELQVVNPLPTSNSADSTKVLTVNSSGAPVWAAAQGGTTYSAGDGIAISNDTIAADVDGTTIGIDSTTKKIKLLSAIPTVDQTYNASSTNAQSGTAVAGALAAVPTKPIVAGSNITITENTNDITLAATMPTVDQTYSAVSTNAQSGVAVASAISTAIGPIETALSNL
ncbi:MAG: hypothetical protein J6T78_04125 [Bacteroidaceae bacterium]|nr:hypothetical protein [Bacteroidaceae bacterium]